MQSEILLLSCIQGLSEFLPVSSSVHFHFFSKIFAGRELPFSMDIALHAGSLITLLIFFRRDIGDILRGLFSSKKQLSETYFFQLVCGTIPIVVIGFLSRKYVKEFNSVTFMGVSSIIFGGLLFIFDKLSLSKKRGSSISIVESVIVGCFQVISILPGVSRLGICLTAARMISINRKQALHFTFLLGIPSILGSITLELFDYGKNNAEVFPTEAWMGILTTSIVGLLAIRLCIRYMERNGFWAIAIYRAILGLVVCFL
jgi:undecaprenyl-diphosphatase